MRVECWNDGKRCSEMKYWHQNFEKEMNEFNEYFDSEDLQTEKPVVPAKCSSVGSISSPPSPPKSCSLPDFWDYVEANTEKNLCLKNETGTTTYLFKSSLERCKNFRCLYKWSDWDTFSIDENECVDSVGSIKKLRFCRQSPDCVIVEAHYTRCDGITDKYEKWDRIENC